jgi:hypothetical protein
MNDLHRSPSTAQTTGRSTRRILVTILAAAAALMATTAAVNAAGGPERKAAASTAAAKPERIARSSSHMSGRVNCRTLSCVNSKLNALFRDTYKCQRLVDLTRYEGYVYTRDGASGTRTTALDYTESGDTPSDQFVIHVCN